MSALFNALMARARVTEDAELRGMLDDAAKELAHREAVALGDRGKIETLESKIAVLEKHVIALVDERDVARAELKELKKNLGIAEL